MIGKDAGQRFLVFRLEERIIVLAALFDVVFLAVPEHPVMAAIVVPKAIVINVSFISVSQSLIDLYSTP